MNFVIVLDSKQFDIQTALEGLFHSHSIVKPRDHVRHCHWSTSKFTLIAERVKVDFWLIYWLAFKSESVWNKLTLGSLILLNYKAYINLCFISLCGNICHATNIPFKPLPNSSGISHSSVTWAFNASFLLYIAELVSTFYWPASGST